MLTYQFQTSKTIQMVEEGATQQGNYAAWVMSKSNQIIVTQTICDSSNLQKSQNFTLS